MQLKGPKFRKIIPNNRKLWGKVGAKHKLKELQSTR